MDEAHPPLPDDSPRHEAFDSLESVELEDALAARAPRRQQLTRGALVLAALVIALGALLRGALPLPHWSLALARPSPTARSGWSTSQGRFTFTGQSGTPGPVNIYSNVSYGAVTLNGKRLAGSPPLSVPPLPAGRNTLTLDAAPFPPVTCAIDAIGASSESGTAYQADGPCSIGGYANGIDITIYLDGEGLAPTVAARAISTLRVAVGQLPTEYADVPAGEYYATGIAQDGTIIYARATQSLGALLDYAPNTTHTPTDQFSGFGGTCSELFCGGATFTSPPGAAAWLVSEPVLLRMRFETPDGTPMGALTLPASTPLPFALAYRADGTWQTVNLSTELPQPRADQCLTGFTLLQAQLRTTTFAGNGGSFGGSAQTLAGCKLTAGTNGAGAATFIWRFGVLLAADAAAHALLPALPMAPPSAIQALTTSTP